MPGKSKLIYQCRECGFESAKWMGKCPGCGEWNTLEETIKEPVTPQKKLAGNGGRLSKPTPINEISTEEEARYHTGLSELDRVLGGGIVKGSLVLISGDPGIGKSTMLLQICEHLGQTLRILYVSGEESSRQIKLRASRLGVQSPHLEILTETDVQYIMEEIRSTQPDLVMIDSIQTMNHTDLTSSPGSVTQVRECTNADDALRQVPGHPHPCRGPRQQGRRHRRAQGPGAHRGRGALLRGRPPDDLPHPPGGEEPLRLHQRDRCVRHGGPRPQQVENPSQAMLSGRPKDVSGTCVTAVMEGTRPLLAEIQGLATTSGFGTPRRMATGFDYNRMALILAVLEKRAGYYFSNLDSYVNVVGGLRLDEPSVDLAVAVALISSLKDKPVREDTVVFGEIGLTGELRSVSHSDLRVAEAARLGFTRCVVPYHGLKNLSASKCEGVEVIGARNIRDAFEAST